ncbi:hypothetical protein ACFLQ1_01960 [Candidatus Auribacterota bacterium]
MRASLKKFSLFVFFIGVIFFFNGCIVWSVNPFYTDDAVIEMPALNGKWQPIKIALENKSDKAWHFESDTILTFDKEGEPGSLKAVYFKIGDDIYLDTMPDDPDETGVGMWWIAHVFPVHTLCKVELSEDKLILRPLSYKWFNDAIEKKIISLPFSEQEGDDDMIIYYPSAKEWMAFLKTHGKEEGLFSQEDVFEFVKTPTEKK